MKAKLTPHFMDLVYDACLKSFWRKQALSKFLRQCGISNAFVGNWGPSETKREFLDRFFAELMKSDRGMQGVVRIAACLMEQRSFPDLQGWEDSEQKVKNAHDAVSRLRMNHEKQEEEFQSDEEKIRIKIEFEKHQAEVTRSKLRLQELTDRLNEMGKRLGEQRAGYDFQSWFYDLLDFSEIENRKPYVHRGRQIDGSVTLAGTTYLVELKFTASPVDPAAVGDFFKKITGKADNTMGIMVSISGYTDTAKQEASGPRTPMLLLDHSHIYLVLGGLMGIGDVIERIRRHASQTGEAYLPAIEFSG